MPADIDTCQSPTQLVLDRLECQACNSSPDGADWVSPCPYHPDTGLDLRVSTLADENVALICTGGCSEQEILDALGLTAGDLQELATIARSGDSALETYRPESLDWRNRDLLPDYEPVSVYGDDEDGHFRIQDITWGDINGDYANTPSVHS